MVVSENKRGNWKEKLPPRKGCLSGVDFTHAFWCWSLNKGQDWELSIVYGDWGLGRVGALASSVLPNP